MDNFQVFFLLYPKVICRFVFRIAKVIRIVKKLNEKLNNSGTENL